LQRIFLALREKLRNFMSTQELRPGQLKILKAVATLLENPANRITIGAVAREVGVTDAAIYRHYRSKEDIFQAIMDYMEVNFFTPLNSVQQDSGDTRHRLDFVFKKFMDFFAGHPGLARLFLGHGANEAAGMAGRIQIMHAKLRSQIVQILRHGQAQQALRANVTPEHGTELFYGLVVAAAMAQVYNFPQLPVVERWSVFSASVLS
jgi:TetR/AcrR family transcriptional regulator